MPQLPEAGSPNDWLRHAHSDLGIAEFAKTPGVLFETLCFHSHQVCEKSLKAVLLKFGKEIPRTHHIRILLNLAASVVSIPEEIEQASILTQYAVSSRYPGDDEPVSESEYQNAVIIAKKVISWAESVITDKSNQVT